VLGCLVERWFWRVWSRWPLIIALDRGGCLRRSVGVMPGKLVMKPLRRARCKVDKAGENKAAWAKATRSAGVAEPTVANAEWSIGGAGGGVGRRKCHNKVLGVRCPVRTTVSLMETFTLVAVKATAQPASHN
jgi:hypothetical protein